MKHSPIVIARMKTSTIKPIPNAMYKISMLLFSVSLLGSVGPAGNDDIVTSVVEPITDSMAVNDEVLVVVGAVFDATESTVLVECCIDLVTAVVEILSLLLDEIVPVGPACVQAQ